MLVDEALTLIIRAAALTSSRPPEHGAKGAQVFLHQHQVPCSSFVRMLRVAAYFHSPVTVERVGLCYDQKPTGQGGNNPVTRYGPMAQDQVKNPKNKEVAVDEPNGFKRKETRAISVDFQTQDFLPIAPLMTENCILSTSIQSRLLTLSRSSLWRDLDLPSGGQEGKPNRASHSYR